MKHPKNTIYYFGDLDYEGIGIYENLAEKFRSRWKIIPFVPAYQAMLGKAEQITELPETKEHQNRNISTQFFSCFDEIMVKKMEAVLDKDRYIPSGNFKYCRFLMQILTQRGGYITVHSVLSNVAKIHSIACGNRILA